MMLNNGPAMRVEAATRNVVDEESSLAIVKIWIGRHLPRASLLCGSRHVFKQTTLLSSPRG